MAVSKIIIVGAGPAGLLLALLLAKDGINVELLEMTHGLDKRPRASHYGDSSCYEFERAGILDQVRAEGFMPNGVSWRKVDEAKTRIVAVGNPGGGRMHDSSATAEEAKDDKYRMVCLPLHRLGKILEAAVETQPTAKILYGHRVLDIGQDEGKAWVRVETTTGGEVQTHTREADYIVGCDGANSKIRQSLFGTDVFPGFTWEEQIVATDMYYDFSPYDYDDSQFFVDKDHWHMVAKIQPDGLYRVTYGELPGLTPEQLLERQPMKYAAFLPGNPDPSKYKIVNFSPYRVHQRCVDKMRVGRFLLAADAAHLCNPFGGLGLTGGIADVGSLYEALAGIHKGLADDSILDRYDEARRRVYQEIINPRSTENLRRLFTLDAETAAETDPFFKMVKQAENDPELRERMKHAFMALRADMTQYYNKPA